MPLIFRYLQILCFDGSCLYSFHSQQNLSFQQSNNYSSDYNVSSVIMETTGMTEMKARLSQFLRIPESSDSPSQWITPSSGAEILIGQQKGQEWKKRS